MERKIGFMEWTLGMEKWNLGIYENWNGKMEFRNLRKLEKYFSI
jgi:hypothetical protein